MLLIEKYRLRRLTVAVALSCSLIPQTPSWATPTILPITATAMSASQGRAELLAALPGGMTPYYLNALSSLYAARQMQPMWQDHQAEQQFQQQLAELAISGIQPQFTQWVKLLTDPAVTGMARDIVLSDAMLGYLQFVSGVGANGNRWLYSKVPYRLDVPAASVINQWQLALKDDALADYIVRLAPNHPQYAKMQQALKNMMADTRPWPQMTSTESLRPGQLSDDIPALREILTRTGMMLVVQSPGSEAIPLQSRVESNGPAVSDGDMIDSDALDSAVVVSPSAAPISPETAPTPTIIEAQPVQPVTLVDNHYSEELVAAVKRFQQWQGLDDDGVIGKRTRDWLNVSPQTRAALLALNIQRLRILPGYVDTGIMVNIPNYSLIYYQNGAEVLSSRVIVGRPSRKTPLMSNALNNVVVNPPWNVPTTLTRQDIVPKAMRDPGYLQRNGYTVFAGWSNDAESIDPAMIDWSMVSPNHFPYRLRQAPGATNSLGRFKFNMPNSEAIYLHDTPNHNLFNKDIRALSSGCVRVNKASELANMLLQDAGWNSARVASTLKQGNTTYVPIRDRIPVNLYYLTAWVGEDGKPQFRTDIYNYDGTVRSGAQILTQAARLL